MPGPKFCYVLRRKDGCRHVVAFCFDDDSKSSAKFLARGVRDGLVAERVKCEDVPPREDWCLKTCPHSPRYKGPAA